MRLYSIYEVRTEYNALNGDKGRYDVVVATPHQYFTLHKDAQAICDEYNKKLKAQHRKDHEENEDFFEKQMADAIKKNKLLAEAGLEPLREYIPYQRKEYKEPYGGWEKVDGYRFVKEVELDIQ